MIAPQPASWADLDRELDLWGRAGRRATLWWRDDDAVTSTPALGRLLAIAAQHAIPIALAVIPATAEAGLARRLGEEGDIVAVLQHGFAHANHAGPGEKKSELGAHRPAETVLAELISGWQRLTALFGAAATPALVPPWNRIAPAVVSLLSGAGYRGLSTFDGRRARLAAPGLLQVNAHVDIVDWQVTRGFVGTEAALGQLVQHLEARREGRADADEPTGVMTHHLAHDAGCWDFMAALARRLARHPVAVWLPASSIFNMQESGALP
jgi:hypothetical protein